VLAREASTCGLACHHPPHVFQYARRVRRWYLLLLVPFACTLWVPFYNSDAPRLGGVPFFYWYQFAWIGISQVLTAVVYFATRGAAR
jgi:hypothetical protein